MIEENTFMFWESLPIFVISYSAKVLGSIYLYSRSLIPVHVDYILMLVIMFQFYGDRNPFPRPRVVLSSIQCLSIRSFALTF